MGRNRKLKDYGAWWENPPVGGYTEDGSRRKQKVSRGNFKDLDMTNRFDNSFKDAKVKKSKSQEFFSKKSNWHLIFRLFGFTFAFMFAVLSLGDGTLRFIESYKTTIHNENYAFNDGDITFYNYDWEFKIKQLQNFAPMFTINDDYENQNLSPQFYYDSLKRLYNSGDILYDGSWSLSSTGLENDFAKKIYYYRYKFRGNSNPFPVRDIFEVVDGEVIIYQDKLFDKWTNQYEQRALFEDTAFSKYVLGSTLVVLNLPTNFTYNLLCVFDLILRW